MGVLPTGVEHLPRLHVYRFTFLIVDISKEKQSLLRTRSSMFQSTAQHSKHVTVLFHHLQSPPPQKRGGKRESTAASIVNPTPRPACPSVELGKVFSVATVLSHSISLLRRQDNLSCYLYLTSSNVRT